MQFLVSALIIAILIVFFIIPTLQSAQEDLDIDISDSILMNAFYPGKKTVKVSYDEVKNNTSTDKSLKRGTNYDDINNNILNNKKKRNNKGSNNNFDPELFNQLYKSNIKMNSQHDINNKNSMHSYKNDKKNNFNTQQEIEEKNNFKNLALSISLIYGNSSNFLVDIGEFENFFHNGHLSIQQIFQVWDYLAKNNYKKFYASDPELSSDFDFSYETVNKNNKQSSSSSTNRILKDFEIKEQNEIYFMYVLPLKNTIIFVVSCSCFWILYNIQQVFMKKGKNVLAFNLIVLIFTIIVSFVLYDWKYYLSSSILFMKFSLCLKNTTDNLMILVLKVCKEDIDIATEPKSLYQFFLKGIVFLTTSSIMTFLIFNYLNYFINYFIFYGMLLKILNFITAFIQHDFPDALQPGKDFCFFIIGLLNFLISNLHRNLRRFKPVELESDSFYLISEAFTFITITTLFCYIKIQSLDLLNYEEIASDEEDEEKIKKYNNINNIIDIENKPAIEVNKSLKHFTKEDCLWFLVILLGLIMNSICIYYSNYLGFCFLMHFWKHKIKLFGSLFKTRYTRILISLFFIIHIFGFTIITFRNDERMLSIFGLENNIYYDNISSINTIGENVGTEHFYNYIKYYNSNYNLIKLLNKFDILEDEFEFDENDFSEELKNSAQPFYYNFNEVIKLIVKLVGLFYIIYISVVNYEYIYLFNEKTAEIENFETEINNNLLNKLEYTNTDNRKKKKLKQIEFQIIRESKFNMTNFLYINYEFLINYILIVIIMFMQVEIETNLLVKITYDFIQVLFLLRVSIIK